MGVYLFVAIAAGQGVSRHPGARFLADDTEKERKIASERPADKHQTRERLLPYTSARPLPFLSPRQTKKYGAVFERHSHASSASEGTELTHELEAPVLREPHVHLKRQGHK